MGHLITLATYVPYDHPSFLVLIIELVHHPVGSRFRRRLKFDVHPTLISPSSLNQWALDFQVHFSSWPFPAYS